MKILIKGSMKIESEDIKSAEEAAFFREHLGFQDAEFGKPLSAENYQLLRDRFVAACRALGKALATSNHETMVGVTNWDQLKGPSLVHHLIEGINAVPLPNGKKHIVTVFVPKVPEPRDATQQEIDSLNDFERSYERVKLVRKPLGMGKWSASMITDLKDAEAVILIGGGEGTASVAFAAKSFDIPLLPISWFGGAAYDIREVVDFSKMGVDTTQTMCLHDWDDVNRYDSSAAGVLKLAQAVNDSIIKSNKQVQQLFWGVIVTAALFVLLWVFTFLSGPAALAAAGVETQAAQNYTFFALLFIASLVGSGMRTLTKYQEGNIKLLAGRHFAVDLVMGIAISLGLALFYFIGGLSFTGKAILLSEKDNEAINSIQVSLSLIGLAAGFLLPIQQLRQRLENALEENNDNASADNTSNDTR